MPESWKDAVEAAAASQKQGFQTLEKLFSLAQPGGVFSEPVHAEGQTVITASEVVITAGFGYGIGEGGAPIKPQVAENLATVEAAANKAAEAGGGGGGGGGGGWTMGRPVAVVTVNAQGVEVKPVVDVTKLGIAALTTFGAMLLMFSRMNSRSR